MRNIITIAIIFLMCSSCSQGYTDCTTEQVSQMEQAKRCALQFRPELEPVLRRMQVICTDDTMRGCYFEVDACTIGVGSPLAPGRTIVGNHVPAGNAIAHEAEHWAQMERDDCVSHSTNCDWNQKNVDTCSVWE